MSFHYGINRLLGLQDSNFQVSDMDVKDDKITYTVRHREPARYLCKHCGHSHDSYHDKDWVHLLTRPKVVGQFEGTVISFSHATRC